MRHIGPLLAIAGFVLAVMLFAREDVGGIVALVIAAGPGLVLAALFHVLPMIANARAWQCLLPEPQRPSVRVLAWATWVRESVNGLLPVARIGGEIVAYRIVRRHVAVRCEAAASLVADMTLSVLSQAAFALFGLALLFAMGHTSHASTLLLAGVASMISLGARIRARTARGCAWRGNPHARSAVRGSPGSCPHSVAAFRSRRFATRTTRRRGVGTCFAWQFAGWMLGAGEIWLALFFLGQHRSLVDAVVVEALIQAVSSAAFIVPGALGVQEGGFILVGAALGIDATTALALATARRLRDVIIFFPGLISWQWAEARFRNVRSASPSQAR